MPRLTITEAFARYKAPLRNHNWSVSAWAPDGSLVLSLWDHHCRKGPPGTMEFADSLSRWKGPGNAEYRTNVIEAHRSKARVRLIIVSTPVPERVQAGGDLTEIPKNYSFPEDVVGTVVELDGDSYVVRFAKT